MRGEKHCIMLHNMTCHVESIVVKKSLGKTILKVTLAGPSPREEDGLGEMHTFLDQKAIAHGVLSKALAAVGIRSLAQQALGAGDDVAHSQLLGTITVESSCPQYEADDDGVPEGKSKGVSPLLLSPQPDSHGRHWHVDPADPPFCVPLAPVTALSAWQVVVKTSTRSEDLLRPGTTHASHRPDSQGGIMWAAFQRSLASILQGSPTTGVAVVLRLGRGQEAKERTFFYKVSPDDWR